MSRFYKGGVVSDEEFERMSALDADEVEDEEVELGDEVEEAHQFSSDGVGEVVNPEEIEEDEPEPAPKPKRGRPPRVSPLREDAES